MNLLSNAIKFTQANGSINCSLYALENQVQIVIEDNGPGIEKELHKVIFDRFFQAELSLTRHYGGTGLGLSIVKDFIDLHRGQIQVSDKKPHGVIFTLTIPLKAPLNAQVSPEAPPLIDMEMTKELINEFTGLWHKKRKTNIKREN